MPTGRIIDQAAFDDGLGIARQGLEALVDSGVVVGAFFYGSSVWKQVDVCSDIDAFVAVSNFNQAAFNGLSKVVSQVERRSGIYLSLTVYTVGQLRTGRHNETVGKIVDLRSRASINPSQIVGQNPFDLISLRDKDFVVEVDELLTKQTVNIAWSYIHHPEQGQEGLLEQVLSVPQRDGRKTLDALIFSRLIPESVMPDMRKDTIAAAVADLYGRRDPRVVELQIELRRDLAKYMQLVKDVRAGTIDQAKYERTIKTLLARNAPKAIEFTERVQEQFRHLANLPVPAALF